ncbi:membrane protein [Stutzerimonas stutzeri]|uniref:Membrane protein n=1 Tax=Stutzerimonas stutzeri TaxID=316 RepID=W8QVB5_STUST|nr:DUF4129 domain-containing protein [Stutzerimonas stutzeri]AHL74505.1 membrane protein [Stutzerimonas stutzeri]MCQ4329032.1 DUF4129 domain-containing protein [Stutzerimonas stutzeri]
MRLSDATMEIRPRNAWESLDLGTLLARRQAQLLGLSWALLTLPVFALLSLVFWRHPTLSLLLFWWLKPLYERLPLFILSRSLFGDTPTLRRSFRALPGLLRSQWFSSLTWRRFSLTRSFDLPVLQLEELSGSTRRYRLTILKRRDTGAARWLTIVGVHLESGLWMGALALLYMLIPTQLLAEWTWQDLLKMEGDWLWLEHLSNLLYVLILIIWEPIYVASGFSLYLNRRTILEAWDIELSFRRLRARLQPLLPVLLLGISLLLVLPVKNAHADTPTVPAIEQPAPAEPSPESARLLKQPLTSQAASERVTELLNQPPFRNRETVTRWRFGEPQAHAEPGWLEQLLNRLLRGGGLQRSFEHVATGVEIMLWATLFGLIALTLWRYREWLRVHVGRLRPAAARPRQDAPAVLFGLDVLPENLPADVAGEVSRLWDEQPREALGLLYRAFLSRLLHERKLPLKSAHTEGEILDLLRQDGRSELVRYAETLTGYWQNLAYGHQIPPSTARNELCDRWRELFGTRTSV